MNEVLEQVKEHLMEVLTYIAPPLPVALHESITESEMEILYPLRAVERKPPWDAQQMLALTLVIVMVPRPEANTAPPG